jgi:hypothetical protein
MKLNLGCGARVIEGWINVDYGVGARFAKLPWFRAVNSRLKLFHSDWDPRIFIHDLRRPFPWETETVGVVYSSHTLEHLSREEGLAFLGECQRVLRRGGIIRILVPDLAHIVSEYLNGRIPADRFLDRLTVLYHPDDNPLKAKLAPFVQFPHRCMYDLPTLKAVAAERGIKLESRGAFESLIPDIRQIELQHQTENAVIVEGTKT